MILALAALLWWERSVAILVGAAAGISAVVVIWTKGIRPLIHGIKQAHTRFGEMSDAIDYVLAEMQSDSGKSVKDIVQKTERNTAQTELRLAQIETSVRAHDLHLDRLGMQINMAVQSTATAAGTLAQHTQEEMERYGTIVSMFLSLADPDAATVMKDILRRSQVPQESMDA